MTIHLIKWNLVSYTAFSTESPSGSSCWNVEGIKARYLPLPIRWDSSTHTALSFNGPIVSWYPLNWTVHEPLPPDFVMIMISPLLFPGPDLAMILLLDIHSADNKQSELQIIRPADRRIIWSYAQTKRIAIDTNNVIGPVTKVFASNSYSSTWRTFFWRNSCHNRSWQTHTWQITYLDKSLIPIII